MLLKLSIVVPMYGVEKYIERCLMSLTNQDISSDDYEIIAVNDGSPDRSADIAKEIAAKHSNIRVIDQNNQGLSMARNNGMDIAKGEYIWFVDSDDWIVKDCLGKIVSILKEESPDVLLLCAANFINDSLIRRFSYEPNRILNGIDWLKQFKSPCAQFNIWKRSFLDKFNLRFMKGIFHEDSEFTPRAAYYADNIKATNAICYVTYPNPQSITHTLNIKRPLDIINHVCTSLAAFSKDFNTRDKQIFSNIISKNINNALNCTIGASGKQIQLVNEALYSNRMLFKHLIHSSILKYKLEGVLFILFPKKYISIYNYLKKIK